MRTAVIITGGTILSEKTSGSINLSDNRANEILSLIPNGFEAEVFSPYFILSEQLNGEYLTALIDTVGGRLNENFDGIIILHGTDTLQYSAAALSLAYGNSDIPIVFVSANYILTDCRSNGKDNLYYAFRFLEQKIGGIFVSYRNTGEKPSIYLGHTLLPHLPYGDSLYSTCGAFGLFEEDRFIKLISKRNIDTIGSYSLTKNSPVLWICATAGMTIPDTDKYSAVLIETYHSGTLPTENERFIRFCRESNIPVYVVGVSEGVQYASTESYNRLGLNILPPISPVFAYVLLWQKYSR